MNGFSHFLCLWLALTSLPNAFAAKQDIKGSADHPMVSRYDDSFIMTYLAKDLKDSSCAHRVQNDKMVLN